MAQRRRTNVRSLFAAAMIGAVIGSVNGFRGNTAADLTDLGGQVGGSGDSRRSDLSQTSSGKSSSASKSANSSSASSKSREASSEVRSSERSWIAGGSSSKGESKTQVQSSSRDTYVPPFSNPGSDDGWKKEEEERRRGEEERRRKEEEERRNAEEVLKQEEARRQTETEWKRMEEEKQRISAEAMQRLQQEEAVRQKKIDEARISAVQSTNAMGESALGCTDAKGLWTTDRSECSYQETVHPDPVYVNPEVEAAQQEEIRRKMMDRYVAEEQSSQKQFLVAGLIGETLERLVAVRDANLLSSPEQQKFVDDSIQWLRGGQEYFATPGRTDDEVAQMSGYIRQIVDYAQQVTDEARKARIAATGSLPEIGAIFGRTEKMLNVFPDVLAVLSTEGVEINQDVINAYGAIATRFAEIRNACMLDAKVCGQLDEVLGGLEQLQAYVISAINAAGKPEVETLINEVVRARLAQ